MSQILGLDQVTSRRCTQGMAYQKLGTENADLVLRKSVKQEPHLMFEQFKSYDETGL